MKQSDESISCNSSSERDKHHSRSTESSRNNGSTTGTSDTTPFVIHVASNMKTLRNLVSEETDAERVVKEEGTLSTFREEMSYLWSHFAYYSHRFVPRDLDHLTVAAATSFVRDLCQVMRRQRGGRRGHAKSCCKEMDRASTKILLYAICRRGKSVSMMFGDFIRLIFFFSTRCTNGLVCCSTCIMKSLQEDVRVDQLVFRYIKRGDCSAFTSDEKSRLKQFRDFVKTFVLFKIPRHRKMKLVFRSKNHKRPTELIFRGHYDDMLSKRLVSSVRKLFLSFTIVDHRNATTQTGGHHVDTDSMRKSTRSYSRTGGGVISRIYWPQFYLICEHLRLNTVLQVRDIARVFFDSATPEIEHVDRSFFDHHFDRRTKLSYVRAMTSKDFAEALFRLSVCLNKHDHDTSSMNVDSFQDSWTPLFRFVALQNPIQNNAFVLTALQQSALNAFLDQVAFHIGSFNSERS